MIVKHQQNEIDKLGDARILKWYGPKTALVGGRRLGGYHPRNLQWSASCAPRGGKRQSKKGEFLPDNVQNWHGSSKNGVRRFKDLKLTQKKKQRKIISYLKKEQYMMNLVEGESRDLSPAMEELLKQ